MALRKCLEAIAADAEADTKRYDGMPFTGKTMAMITGEQNAMIQALALSMIELVDMWEALNE